jgi:ferredoxin
MKTKRLIIKIDEDLCNGCGQCIVNCAESALYLEDGKARLRAEKYCDGLGACLGHCPTGALTLHEEVVDSYDHHAVEALIQENKVKAEAESKPLGCGCPSRQVMTMAPAEAPSPGVDPEPGQSFLSHWPIQLRLLPVNAPYLKGASILLTADCVPVSLPDFHARYVPGRVVLLACPKLDDAEAYVDKLAEMLAANQFKDITVLEMEVPCCAGMSRILDAAQRQARTSVPVETVIISRQGAILPGRPGMKPL